MSGWPSLSFMCGSVNVLTVISTDEHVSTGATIAIVTLSGLANLTILITILITFYLPSAKSHNTWPGRTTAIYVVTVLSPRTCGINWMITGLDLGVLTERITYFIVVLYTINHSGNYSDTVGFTNV